MYNFRPARGAVYSDDMKMTWGRYFVEIGSKNCYLFITFKATIKLLLYVGFSVMFVAKNSLFLQKYLENHVPHAKFRHTITT